MLRRSKWVAFLLILAVTSLIGLGSRMANAQDEAAIKAEVQKQVEALTAAFNAGKAADMAAMFLVSGEVIDEEGNVYQGQEQIKTLLETYFSKFPGLKLENQIESIRLVGPVAIQEGNRLTTAADGTTATVRYIAVLSKGERGWRIASLRDFPVEYIPTPGDMLQVLGWLVGDWVNEGTDGRVKISYQWSEDKNFILGDVAVTSEGQVVSKSSQRIGWDPVLKMPRSWLFDSDGGFAEWYWTAVDNMWVIRSTATLPDGQIGSALVKIVPNEDGRYTMTGSSRLVGNILENDYEIVIVKKPPTPAKQQAAGQ